MKKIFSLKTMLLLLGAVLAAGFLRPEAVYAKTSHKYVIDDADILSDSDENKLENQLKEISERLKFDVVVVTTHDLEGKSPMAYADDYYDYHDYGQDEARSGCLFLRFINGSDKDLWIATRGEGITALYDDYIQYIFDEITAEFKNNDYYGAFAEYGQLVDQAVSCYYDTGKPIEYKEKLHFPTFSSIAFAIAVAVIAGFIYAGKLKGQLKSVQTATEANAYQSNFVLNTEKDRFIRSAVTKTARESSSSSSHGSGGSHHSSTHTSSSGASHGGGGRHM